MKINGNDELSSYLANLYKTQQNQNTDSGVGQKSNSGNSVKRIGLKDTLEISSDAYASYAADSAVNGAYPVPPPAPMQSMSQTLDSLVDDGTITEDQQSQIMTAISSYADSEEEETAYTFSDILDSLVADGTITEDQENTIKNSMAPPPPPTGGTENEEDTAYDDLEEILEQLVSDETLTSEQADAVLSALTSASEGEPDIEIPVHALMDRLAGNGTVTNEQESIL